MLRFLPDNQLTKKGDFTPSNFSYFISLLTEVDLVITYRTRRPTRLKIETGGLGRDNVSDGILICYECLFETHTDLKVRSYHRRWTLMKEAKIRPKIRQECSSVPPNMGYPVFSWYTTKHMVQEWLFTALVSLPTLWRIIMNPENK